MQVPHSRNHPRKQTVVLPTAGPIHSCPAYCRSKKTFRCVSFCLSRTISLCHLLSPTASMTSVVMPSRSHTAPRQVQTEQVDRPDEVAVRAIGCQADPIVGCAEPDDPYTVIRGHVDSAAPGDFQCDPSRPTTRWREDPRPGIAIAVARVVRKCAQMNAYLRGRFAGLAFRVGWDDQRLAADVFGFESPVLSAPCVATSVAENACRSPGRRDNGMEEKWPAVVAGQRHLGNVGAREPQQTRRRVH